MIHSAAKTYLPQREITLKPWLDEIKRKRHHLHVGLNPEPHCTLASVPHPSMMQVAVEHASVLRISPADQVEIADLFHDPRLRGNDELESKSLLIAKSLMAHIAVRLVESSATAIPLWVSFQAAGTWIQEIDTQSFAEGVMTERSLPLTFLQDSEGKPEVQRQIYRGILDAMKQRHGWDSESHHDLIKVASVLRMAKEDETSLIELFESLGFQDSFETQSVLATIALTAFKDFIGAIRLS